MYTQELEKRALEFAKTLGYDMVIACPTYHDNPVYRLWITWLPKNAKTGTPVFIAFEHGSYRKMSLEEREDFLFNFL